MKMYYGYAECNNCHDVEGPWVLDKNRFLCESCYEKYVKKLLATPYIKDKKQHNDKA